MKNGIIKDKSDVDSRTMLHTKNYRCYIPYFKKWLRDFCFETNKFSLTNRENWSMKLTMPYLAEIQRRLLTHGYKTQYKEIKK